MRRAALLVAVVLCAACADHETAIADLSTPAPDDLSIPDLGEPPDLRAPTDLARGFCDRLNDARNGGAPSDCAVAYFIDLLRCIQPMGACAELRPDGGASLYQSYCWDDGTSATRLHLPGIFSFSYSRDGHMRCRYGGDSSLLFGGFCLASDSQSCDPVADAGPLPFSNARFGSGIFTCPDGTEVPFGPLDSDCIYELLALTDPNGRCDHQGTATVCAGL